MDPLLRLVPCGSSLSTTYLRISSVIDIHIYFRIIVIIILTVYDSLLSTLILVALELE